jgi:hypothetical protein
MSPVSTLQYPFQLFAQPRTSASFLFDCFRDKREINAHFLVYRIKRTLPHGFLLCLNQSLNNDRLNSEIKL